ncbi:calcium-binding protein, partial [Novosphingobium sp. NDB2Meth1]|uniref:calcium-binding protein n=1 Tax=Novosphingobium sp. NDB2Meth1 TaxID=1892847 RepID=UPI0015C539E4
MAIITGTGSNDTLSGTSANGELTGGAGNDIFAFTGRLFGEDVITDFVQGQDRINLSALGIADLATLRGYMAENLGNTIIRLVYDSTPETITINGVLPSQLTASDFIFNTATTASSLTGTVNGDMLFSSNGNDTLNGGGGDDVLNSGAGADTLNGGGGDDVLNSGAGADTLVGGNGDDWLTGGNGNDIFRYPARQFGNDVIADFVSGQDKIDLSILGGADLPTLSNYMSDESGSTVIRLLYGGAPETITIHGVLLSQLTADDFIFNPAAPPPTGTVADDVLFGGNGNDTLDGSSGYDDLYGGAGADTLIGGIGNDLLTGGSGNDIFAYTALAFNQDVITDFVRGQDRINLAPLGFGDLETLSPFVSENLGNTVISLPFSKGTITINGIRPSQLTASDFIFDTATTAKTLTGTLGRDVLIAGNGNDTLNGRDGDDVLIAGAGADTLIGGDGNDTLWGGSGDDTLFGGSGADTLTGGSGNDIFSGSAAELNGDTITDLDIGDRITFTGAAAAGSPAFTYSLSGNTLTFTGGSLTLQNLRPGTIVTAAAGASPGNVDLVLQRGGL